MTKQITTLQAMQHPDVVATINVLSEMNQRLQDENDELKKPWVALTDVERDDLVAAGYDRTTINTVNILLKGKNT